MAQKLENLIDKNLLADYDEELKKTYIAGGIVFDISAHKATGSPATPATFASLTAALGTNGANIPQNMRKGGMTVKFIKGSAQSQSNKYVQYRLKTQTFSTSEADWECIEDSVSALEEAVGTGGSVDERIAAEGARHYLKAETYTKTEVNGLVDTPHQEYVTVEHYADLPATGSADTIYRVSNWDGSANSGQGAVDATVYSEYAWDGSKYVFLCVKSLIGEVFDISVYNNNAVYADLAAALGTDGANVPESLRKGGMSVKFIQGSVQSTDNKYVQYRLMSDSWSAYAANWERYNDVTTSNESNSDLDIADDQGNVLVRFQDGDIKTKNFDSSNNVTTEKRGLMSAEDKVSLDESVAKLSTVEEGAEVNDIITDNTENADLDFSDEKGNVVMRLANGHIKTKNFDSSVILKLTSRIDKTLDFSSPDNPIENIVYQIGFSSLILNWGFIGDSLMSGVPNTNAVPKSDLIPMPSGRNFYKYSWGQMMCRLTGAFGTNYSHGGQNAKSWLSTYPNTQRNDRYNTDGTWDVDFSNTHKVAYAINLGTNDTIDFDDTYTSVGTIENVHNDSSDYTEDDLNTFYGCYGKIISLCKEVSPSSRIFLITTPHFEHTNMEEIEDAPRQIVNSNIFNHVYLVDLARYMPDIRIYGKLHPYQQGYLYQAYAFMNYVDYIIRKYPQDFKNIAFIEYLKNDIGQI